MNNLKLLEKSEIEIYSWTIRLLNIDTAVKLGLVKCATVAINQGKLMKNNRTEMSNDQTIRNHQNEAYKYLYFLYLVNNKHGQVKNVICKE